MDVSLRSSKPRATTRDFLPDPATLAAAFDTRGAPSAPSRFVSVIAGNDGKIIGIRVIEADFDSRTLSFYAGLGYVVREALACIQGPALGIVPRGPVVRAMRENDIETCDRLCRRIYGYDRDRELRDGVAQKTAVLVERQERITGYATAIGFRGHAVGEENRDLQALIGAADGFAGPGFLVPTRNDGLLRWCLEHGLRVVQPLTLLTRGTYAAPAGCFLPSILF